MIKEKLMNSDNTMILKEDFHEHSGLGRPVALLIAKKKTRILFPKKISKA